MSLALQCRECGRTIHSTALNGICASCLVTSTRSGLSASPQTFSGEVLSPGQIVGPQDRFLLLKRIGRGGMGEIWLANDEHLSRGPDARPVALKFLSEEIRFNVRAMELLRKEVARSQLLNHPNIVRIHDLHTTLDGTPFIKMEYVEGDSLAHWLRASGEPMPWRMACELGAQVASALEYAHNSASLVHRDVKPGNILVGKGPTAKLTDFGIAQALHEFEDGAEPEPMGTMAYAGPEQIQGLPPSPADDVHALGATLYELLTGTVPSEAATTEALRAHTIYTVPENLNARLQRLGRDERVPGDLASLVARCLQKRAADRPPMKRVAAMLGQLIGTTEEAAPKPRSPSWWQPVALAFVLIAAIPAYKSALVKDARAKMASVLHDLFFTVPESPKSPDIPSAPAGAKPKVDGNSEARPFFVPPPPRVEDSPPPPPGTIGLAISWEKYGSPGLQFQLRHEGNLVPNEKLREAVVSVLPQGSASFRYSSSETGLYEIVVTSANYPDIKAARQIQLESGKTLRSPIDVHFGSKRIQLISSPRGAKVQWRSERFGASEDLANGGARDFQTEVPYRFWFSLRGYKTVYLEKVFQGKADDRLFVPLEERLTPEFGPESAMLWTNRVMGMVFRRLGALRVCTTETTVGQFRRFVEAANRHDTTNGMFSMGLNGRQRLGHSWADPGFPQSDQHPVIGVSLADARDFCAWLTQSEEGSLDPGQAYRLPTVQEWKMFSGAGPFPWGSGTNILGNFAGIEVALKNSENPGWPRSFPYINGHRDPWPRTAPVTADPSSSPDGLAFLAGNAAEWCQGGEVCGGSWFDGESLQDWSLLNISETQRTLNTLTTEDLRQTPPPGDRDDRFGFRVVLSASGGTP